MSRLVCLDVGDKRIGIAVSDPLGMFASPHSVIERVGWGPDIKAIRRIFDEAGADRIICGLPRNMDGSEGFQAAKVREFACQLEKNGMRVEFTDERLSTVEAEHALLEGGMSREKRRTHVDKVAAAVILQRYLDKASIERTAPYGTEKEDAMTDDTGRKDPAFEEDEDEDDEDYGNQIIELTDEDGVTSQFEYLTTVEHEGKLYVVLMLLDEEADQDDDEGEVIILEIQKDENGEDVYASVEDDAVSDAVFQKFLEIVDEQDEEED